MPDALSILIVEDEPSVRSLLKEVLTPKFQCSSAESASEAIPLIESAFFHAALVDLGLPGMSGLGLCQVIGKLSPNTHPGDCGIRKHRR
jgi:DNA-binding response OmpR family regulator